MSVPPNQMMELMKKGQAGGKTPPAPMPSSPDTASMSDVGTPPMAAPMSTPEPKLGNQEGAMINLSMAMDLIEQSLPVLGSESELGQKALQAIRALSGVLGPRKGKTNELQQSEILQMMQSLPAGVQPGMQGGPGGAGMPPPPSPAAPPMPPGGGGAVPPPTM